MSDQVASTQRHKSHLNEGQEPVPALWPVLLLCAIAAVWIDFGTIHRYHNADSLLPVLVSLYRWTLFYWEQDRMGMLVPLLALPFKNPFVNLLVQDGLVIFCGLATMCLVVRYVLPHTVWPVVGLLSIASFLVLVPPEYRFEFLVNQPYGVSLALGLSGLIVAELRQVRWFPWWRHGTAVVLICLAHWVNVAVAIVLILLVTFRDVLSAQSAQGRIAQNWRKLWSWGIREHQMMRVSEQKPCHGIVSAICLLPREMISRVRRAANADVAVAILFVITGAVFGAVLTRLAPYGATRAGLLPLSAWPVAWKHLIMNTWIALAPGQWVPTLAWAVGYSLLFCCAPGVRQRASIALRAAMTLTAVAVTYCLLIGSLEWVRANQFWFRYLIPSVIFLQVVLMVIVVMPPCAVLGEKVSKGFYALSVPFLLLILSYTYGFPSLAAARSDIDRVAGVRTPDVLAAQATHIVGRYWEVWTTVFHANLVLYERGEGRVIWGVTVRSRPTESLWNLTALEKLCVAIPLHDQLAVGCLQLYRFPPLVLVEQRPTVSILRPEAAMRPKN
jgi:hypothetical protein